MKYDMPPNWWLWSMSLLIGQLGTCQLCLVTEFKRSTYQLQLASTRLELRSSDIPLPLPQFSAACKC